MCVSSLHPACVGTGQGWPGRLWSSDVLYYCHFVFNSCTAMAPGGDSQAGAAGTLPELSAKDTTHIPWPSWYSKRVTTQLVVFNEVRLPIHSSSKPGLKCMCVCACVCLSQCLSPSTCFFSYTPTFLLFVVPLIADVTLAPEVWHF